MAQETRRSKKGWLLLCFLCVGAVIFHQPLLLMGCKAALKRAIPSAEGRTISYENMQWEKGTIAISGLLIKDPSLELKVNKIELKWAADFWRLRFRGKGIVLSSPKMGIALQGDEVQGSLSFWSLKGSFGGLTFPVNEATSIRDARFDIAFDSKNQTLSVEKGEGIWELIDGSPFTVQIKRLSMQPSENGAVDFALQVFDGEKEFIQIEGKATRSPSSEWELAFDNLGTHFGGTPLNITHCVLNSELGIASFEMKPTLKCQDLLHQAAFLQNAGLLSPTFSPKNLQEWQLEGTLQAQLFSEDMEKGFFFHAESSDLKVKGQPWTSFIVRGRKMGEKWYIEKLDAGGLSLKGAFVVDTDEFFFPQWETK